MAINPNREEKRLKDSQEKLKTVVDKALLENIITKQEAALLKKNESYPRLLQRHLRKCKAHGWADTRLGGKKK
jgi:hypothetical protein